MPPKAPNRHKSQQSRLSFQTTKPKQKDAPKVPQPQQSINRIASPKHKVQQPSFNEDPRVYELLNQWTDDSPKYHQEEVPLVDKLLGQFDSRMEYGPSSGVSRLQRFNRAQELGLGPPGILGVILRAQDSQSIYT